MSTFDNFVSKARNVAETAGKKTTDFVEVSKLKMSVSDLKRELSLTMEALGRTVYDAAKAGEEPTEQVQEAVEKADRIQDAIKELDAKICAYKRAVRCPSCGAVNEQDATYCKQCGTQLR